MTAASLRALLRVAFTFSGALIGVGFASGRELLQFFITYGSFGFVGIAAAGLLFGWLCQKLLTISYKRRLNSYGAFVRYLCGQKLGGLFETTLSLLLFAVLVIMLAAAEETAGQLTPLPPWSGKLLLACSITAAAGNGADRITRINFFATPFLACVIIAVSASSLIHHTFSFALLREAAIYADQPAPHWLLACVLYVSYNLALSAAVLVPLGRNTPQAAARAYGSLLGGLLLAGLSFLIVATLLVHAPAILTDPLPMLTISCTQNRLHAILYSAVFILAMFTTSLSCLYGCALKLRAASGLSYQLCLPLAAGAAFALSGVGFSHLIATLFPAFGYITFWLLICLIFKTDNR